MGREEPRFFLTAVRRVGEEDLSGGWCVRCGSGWECCCGRVGWSIWIVGGGGCSVVPEGVGRGEGAGVVDGGAADHGSDEPSVGGAVVDTFSYCSHGGHAPVRDEF